MKERAMECRLVAAAEADVVRIGRTAAAAAAGCCGASMALPPAGCCWTTAPPPLVAAAAGEGVAPDPAVPNIVGNLKLQLTGAITESTSSSRSSLISKAGVA